MEKYINLAFVGYPGANHSSFVPLKILLQPFTPQQLQNYGKIQFRRKCHLILGKKCFPPGNNNPYALVPSCSS